MKFIAEYRENIQERDLIYITQECSFNTKPFTSNYEFELILNTLCLSMHNNKIIQVDGFCGLDKSMESNYEVPEYKKGILKVEHNLEPGFSHVIENGFPVRLNLQTGWVCIGYPGASGENVEFMRNCVAVIGKQGEFLALWLKPKSLPVL